MNPEQQFAEWFASALRQEGHEAARCVVATCGLDGQPSARVVYHRPGPSGRVRFFTNYLSRKGRELESNPRVAVVFHWHSLGQQVRVEGTCSRCSSEDSDAYFASRALDSQMASSLSPQSQPIADIAELRELVEQRLRTLTESSVARPAHWGGYEVQPSCIEFWSTGAARLHERQLWTRDGALWRRQALAP